MTVPVADRFAYLLGADRGTGESDAARGARTDPGSEQRLAEFERLAAELDTLPQPGSPKLSHAFAMTALQALQGAGEDPDARRLWFAYARYQLRRTIRDMQRQRERAYSVLPVKAPSAERFEQAVLSRDYDYDSQLARRLRELNAEDALDEAAADEAAVAVYFDAAGDSLAHELRDAGAPAVRATLDRDCDPVRARHVRRRFKLRRDSRLMAALNAAPGEFAAACRAVFSDGDVMREHHFKSRLIHALDRGAKRL